MIKPVAKYSFTKLEQKVIKEIIAESLKKEVEVARYIKDGKDISNQFIFKETPMRYFIYPKDEFLPQNLKTLTTLEKMQYLLNNATGIHFHPKPLPLSFGDVLTAFNYQQKKIIAILQDRRYSIFEFGKKTKIPIQELLDGNKKIKDFLEKHGKYIIFKNPTLWEKYINGMNNYWTKLAQKTEGKYISNIEP